MCKVDKKQKKKGVITVEATLVLPIYILAILFIINFLNIGYMQLVIQQGLNNAGQTFSQYCYALDMLIDLDFEELSKKTVENKTKEAIKAIDKKVTPIKTFVGALSNVGKSFTGLDSLKELGADFLEVMGDKFSDSKEDDSNVDGTEEDENAVRALIEATNGLKEAYGDLMKTGLVKATNIAISENPKEELKDEVVDITKEKLKEIFVEGILFGALKNAAATGAEAIGSFIVKAEVEEYLTEMKVNRSMLDGEISYQMITVNKDEKNDKDELSQQDIILMATYYYKPSIFSVIFKEGIPMRQVVVVRPFIGGSTNGVRQIITDKKVDDFTDKLLD